MSLGVEIQSRTAPAGRDAFTQTDTLFLACDVSAGSTTAPTLVRSIADFEAAYATRVGNEAEWDYLDTFFREGGRRAWVARYTVGAGNLATALAALFSPDLGPGQVVAPSEAANTTTFQALLAHAAANNRVALLDVAAAGDTVGTMTTLAGVLNGLADNVEHGALFGPWVNVPPPAGVVGGVARQVHATAAIAALIARVDADGNVNRAAAGRDYPLQYVTSFTADITAAERVTLLNAGLNTFADKFGVLQNYGFQTAIEQSEETPFWQFNATRGRMSLIVKAQVAGESYMFKPLDGQGRLARALQTDLDAICLEMYQANGLYGETPEEAYSTNVSASVNTELAIAQGELHAVVEARLSMHAKRVLIDLVSVPVTGNVTPAV